MQRLFLIMLFFVGCQRVETATTDYTEQSGALRVISRSKPTAAALTSELSGRENHLNAWFAVANAGAAGLNVKLVSKSCTCVDVMARGEQRTVGDSFVLDDAQQTIIEFVGLLRAASGEQRFLVDFVADDESRLTLEATQTVYRDVECIPDIVGVPMQRDAKSWVESRIELIHTFRSDRPRTGPVVRRETPAGVRVVSVQPRQKPKELEPGLWQQAWNVNLKLRPAAFAEAPKSLEFACGDCAVRVPIAVTRAFGIAAPDNVAFGSVAVGDQRSRRLVMHSLDGLPFKVIRAHADSPEVTASVKESGGRSRYWIELGFQPNAAGDRRSTISIETTHPDSPRLTISAVGRGRVLSGNRGVPGSGG